MQAESEIGGSVDMQDDPLTSLTSSAMNTETDVNHEEADTNQTVSQDSESKLHPMFSDPACDVLIGTADGMRFRVHSQMLRCTSGWFRTMFSLPQTRTDGKLAAGAKSTTIYVDEDALTFERLLRMISGLPILPLENYDDVDTLLYACEKYDTPGPMSIVRLLVMTPVLSTNPLRLYAIACHFGWYAEAAYASTQTLHLNIYGPEHHAALARLSTDALLRLFDLHRARREGLRRRLDDPPFVHGGPALCGTCQCPIDYHTWRELKYKIILEMDVRPLGDTVVGEGLLEWQESKSCWTAKCPNPQCERVLYDKNETLRVIRECIDGLPKCITALDKQ